MRVIAGTARSLRLKTIEGNDTRPTTDRIKETLFNMLTGDVYDANFLDLFAGSGAIGIEALSRGASHCTFVEQNAKAVACIKDNLNHTKLMDKAKVQKYDAVAFLNGLATIDYDVIFMDPPYSNGFEKAALEVLSKKEFETDTLIVIEATLEEDFDYVEALGFEILKEKRYKSNKHMFIGRKE